MCLRDAVSHENTMELEIIMWREKARHRQTHIAWSHWYVESKKARFIEVDSRMVVTKGWAECGRDGNGWPKGTKLQFGRNKKF
jgi:hypothetical protein